MQKAHQICIVVLLYGCGSQLTVNVMNRDTLEPIRNVRVVVAKGEDQLIPDEESTNNDGLANFPSIKKGSFSVEIAKSKDFFGYDSVFYDFSFKDNLVVKLDPIQTILTGRVIYTDAKKAETHGIPNALIKTSPEIVEAKTDSFGYFALKSNLFSSNQKYQIQAFHKDFLFEKSNTSISVNINDRLDLAPIRGTPINPEELTDLDTINIVPDTLSRPPKPQ